MVTAFTLALVLSCVIGAYIAWAAHMVAGGANALWFVVAAPVVLMALPAAFAAISFAISWRYRAERPKDKRLGFAGMIRLYGREVLAVAGSAPRMIAYRWLMQDPPPAAATMPVLLVHGVLCNAGVMHAMKRYLDALGMGRTYALSYGPPLASIELFAEQMAERIEWILAATGAKQVVIVAHSMGGLVARAYLRRYGGASVRGVITIGAPHHGSVLAYVCPGTSLSQLRPGNAWLAELGRARTRADPPFVSIWSWHDSMVAPQTSSILERAKNIALKGIAHNALLRSTEVFELAAEEIKRAQRDQPAMVAKKKRRSNGSRARDRHPAMRRPEKV